MTEIIIVGAGGCGREVVNWIEDINKIEPTWNILGFLDDNRKALYDFPSRYQVIGSIKTTNREQMSSMPWGLPIRR